MVLDYTRLLRKHIAACAVVAATTASFAASSGNTAVNDTDAVISGRVTTIKLRLDSDVGHPAGATEATIAARDPEPAARADAVEPNAVEPSVAEPVDKALLPVATASAAVFDASTQSANNQAAVHNIEEGGIDSGVFTGAGVTAVEAADSGLNSDAEPMLLAASGVKHTYKPVAKSADAAKGSAAPTLKNASYIPPARANEDAKTFRGISLVASSALAVDAQSGETLYFKNPERIMPIASITKLMTAMVVLDAKLPMQETLSIGTADVDRLKNTTSRLPVGTKLNRQEMIRLALMSSENRAASALARHYPGGRAAFLTAMRRKAAALGMTNTRFNDSMGLTPTNVSTARDLVKMVQAASQYPLIRRFTTMSEYRLRVNSVRYPLDYLNTNRLVRGGRWNISLSKTGFINEAGHCLVMMADVGRRPVVMVLLQAPGKLTPLGDATRLRNWIEGGGPRLTVATTK